MKKLITGNEAIGYGALAAGVKVVVGYPGTPSTGTITALLNMDLPDTHVEWSVNEKAAIDIAAGVAWGGHRVLCTMKMSGLNVAYDSLISIAYSGCEGGMVVYTADDPGANAGMCEQDSRGFALMSDMPMLEPTTVPETITMTKYAFELSEEIKGPVFLRLTTALANAFAVADIEPPAPVSQKPGILIHDIARFTKAGAAICMKQHADLIGRLATAEELIDKTDLNELKLAKKSKVGVVAAGITSIYLDEAFAIAADYGLKEDEVSTLKLRVPIPFPKAKAAKLMEHVDTLLVLEELEPYTEKELIILAREKGFTGKIVGKLDGTFKRWGEYGLAQIFDGLNKAAGIKIPSNLYHSDTEAEKSAAARPITVCSGCPHRGTYMAINSALHQLKLNQKDVMVAGDIGCTILGMNPPFNTIWNEISMGASIGMAQGFNYANVGTPVIGTIGDSTFFHSGIPQLINAVQHKANITLIIMDNEWTAMTGMQIDPGTPCELHNKDYANLDIARIVPTLGVEQFYITDPFDQKDMVEKIVTALGLPGVKVILARRECATQAFRHRDKTKKVRMVVIEENCIFCKACIRVTGCNALVPGEKVMTIDQAVCRQCGLCATVCPKKALVKEEN